MEFRKLSIEEAEALIGDFAGRQHRPIRSIDTHHTYRPHKGQWRGLANMQAMDAFHRAPPLNWAMIGQHLTIGPDGSIWTGRPLELLPCSQTGFNTGALMYEMAGNFCAPGEPDTLPPYDTLEGAQLEAAIAVSAAVLANFGLPLACVRFHRQLHRPGWPRPKSCPGDSIDLGWFQGLVEYRCWARWNWDPPGGRDFDAEAAFNAAELEDPATFGGSSHDVAVAMAAFDPDAIPRELLA